jgi:hypothetical protein
MHTTIWVVWVVAANLSYEIYSAVTVLLQNVQKTACSRPCVLKLATKRSEEIIAKIKLYFEWPAHEHTCPLQVQLNQHRHLVNPQNSQGISPYLPIAFVEIVPMPPALAHISPGYHSIPRNYIAWGHLIEDSQSIPHAPTFGTHVNENTSHKDIRLNHFEWSIYEHSFHLQVLVHWHLNKSIFVRNCVSSCICWKSSSVF